MKTVVTTFTPNETKVQKVDFVKLHYHFKQKERVMSNATVLKTRTKAEYSRDKRKAERASKAFYHLCDRAQVSPDFNGDYLEFSKRINRDPHQSTTREHCRKVIEAFENRPHVHAVSTRHVSMSPCSLGQFHNGCCFGYFACDAPGKTEHELYGDSI